MKKKYQQFIIRLTILSLIAGALVYIAVRLFPPGSVSPALPWIIVLLFVVTAIVHYILLRITLLNPRKFVGYFMLTTSLKLMIYLIVMVVYVLNVKEGLLTFVLSFFILYIIYTVFEVVTILSQTKEQTGKK